MPAQQISKARLNVGTTNSGINLDKCGTWNGTSSYLDFTQNATFTASTLTTFTIGVWCKFTSTGQGGFGFIYQMNNFAGLFINGGTEIVGQVYHATTTSLIRSGGGLSLNTWHRVIFQFSNSWNYGKIFIDGVQYYGSSQNKSGARLDSSTGTGTIGNSIAHTGACAGQIDQFEIWNRLLSYDEIVDDWYFGNNANLTSGKIISFRLNEASGDYTDSIAGIVATPSNVTQNVTSYSTSDIVVPARSTVANRQAVRDFGTCLSFDGAGDFVDFGTGPYNILFNGAFTAAGWIKTRRLTGNPQAIIGKQQRVSPFNGWQFTILAGGKLQFEYVTVGATNEYEAQTTNAVIVQKSVWYHVAFVFNNRTMAMYVNGEAVPVTETVETLTSSHATTAKFNIGGRNNDEGAGDSDYDGFLDDFKVFTSALSATNIASLYYNNGSTVVPSSYWKLDEGSGTSVTDSAGAFTGTITGATYSTDIVMDTRTTV